MDPLICCEYSLTTSCVSVQWNLRYDIYNGRLSRNQSGSFILLTYYPGKVKIANIKHRNKSPLFTSNVPGVTLCEMVDGCFVLLLSFSCKGLTVITSRVLVGLPVTEKCFNNKINLLICSIFAIFRYFSV